MPLAGMLPRNEASEKTAAASTVNGIQQTETI
jgi:hypothetical protein